MHTTYKLGSNSTHTYCTHTYCTHTYITVVLHVACTCMYVHVVKVKELFSLICGR